MVFNVNVNLPLASFNISVFTRHSAACSKRDDPQWKRCNCRKSLYVREGGKTRYVSAKTRSWTQAERVAQAERDKRDPVRMELQKIAESNASAYKPMSEALEQWVSGMKGLTESSRGAYLSTAPRIQRWADRMEVKHVSDVTPSMLDEWRGSWAPDAEDRENVQNDRSWAGSSSSSLARSRNWSAT